MDPWGSSVATLISMDQWGPSVATFIYIGPWGPSVATFISIGPWGPSVATFIYMDPLETLWTHGNHLWLHGPMGTIRQTCKVRFDCVTLELNKINSIPFLLTARGKIIY